MDRRNFVAASVATAATLWLPQNAGSQATPSPNQANPFLLGNAFDMIPDGEMDSVQIVVVGEPNEDRLPLVIRNSTDSVIGVDEVIGVARDSSGSIADVVEDSTIVPHVVEPGGIAIGFARFASGGESIVGADFELEVGYGEPNPYIVNLSIAEVAIQGDEMLGLAENTTRDTVDFPRVGAIIFTEDGTIVDYCFKAATSSEVEPGGTAPFILDCFGNQITGLYIIGAIGSSL